jgi:hypothetical protein
MSKTNKILLILVVVLLVVLVVFGVYWFTKVSYNKFYAVYLDTGDLYFGRLSRFPRLTLKNVWYIQRDTQSQNFSLQDFSKAAWGPENKMELNKDRVVWITKISDSSQLIPIMSGKQILSPVPNQNQQVYEQPETFSTSTQR